ncbi:hypothetical protein GIB67_001842 [Kingdonia uniflora]|uniref:60S ribosomal protein L38 n=1 Tax=Kingdonia uniflora TaxID=39325 RepID=A0A7J7LBP6_9MAGN|nr:hypothetical protein GIB67_001842 [Kingdonia uniflora]
MIPSGSQLREPPAGPSYLQPFRLAVSLGDTMSSSTRRHSSQGSRQTRQATYSSPEYLLASSRVVRRQIRAKVRLLESPIPFQILQTGTRRFFHPQKPKDPMQKCRFWFVVSIIPTGLMYQLLALKKALTCKKLGGKLYRAAKSAYAKAVMQHVGLLDLGYYGHLFTWNNNRWGWANIKERLDRSLANADWMLIFPIAKVFHLPAIGSDHTPLCLDTYPKSSTLARVSSRQFASSEEGEAIAVLAGIHWASEKGENKPKQINEIKDFLLTARRKDARSVKIKRSKDVVKFKVRCSKYLYTLCVFDTEKADKLKQSLPPAARSIGFPAPTTLLLTRVWSLILQDETMNVSWFERSRTKECLRK